MGNILIMFPIAFILNEFRMRFYTFISTNPNRGFITLHKILLFHNVEQR